MGRGEMTSSCCVDVCVFCDAFWFDRCDDLFEAAVPDMELASRSAERCMSLLETVVWLPIDDVTIGIVRCERCAGSVL
jgi:hypothetical protein